MPSVVIERCVQLERARFEMDWKPVGLDRLSNGGGFQYTIADTISQSGEQLQGIRVIPDVEVLLTCDALLRGEDPVLTAAVAWIRDGT